ncbi:MAG: type II secretion system secretin GspD [Candidatus Brocadiia bacterium]
MRTLRSAACLAFALPLIFAAAAAFAQPAPATTAAVAATISPAAPTAGAAPAATTSPAAPMTGTAPATTGSAEAPTTEGAAAAVTPVLPPSWTPVQQLAATTPAATGSSAAGTTPPATGASAADTTPPTTGAAVADTIPPEAGASAAGTIPPDAAPSAAGTTQAAPTPVPPGMVTEAPLPVGPPPAASGHVLNFNEAPIDLVLKYLAESVGLQVVKQSPMADVRVTIIGQQPIYVEDTISLLNSALNIKGYAAIRSGANGRVLKIVTLEDAKKLNVPVHKGTQPDLIPTTDEVITQVMPLRYIDATRLRQDLTPLISPSASITSNAAGNSLVVTDTSANVHRIAEIVWALDVNTAGASEVRIYALKNADATSAVKLITDIFKPDTTTGGGGFLRGAMRFMMGRGGGGGGGGTPGADNTTPYQPPTVKASADTRTNSVVVTGPAESLVVVDGIIKALESNGIEPQGVFVYALKNGTSADIAPVLNNIMGTSTATTGVGTRSNQPQGGNAANSALAGQNGLYGQVYVVANPDTNSLLVMTMPKYFEQVKGIIKTLDRPIPQVLIRVLIAEITHEDTIDLGADFSFLNLTTETAPGSRGAQLSSNVAELPNPAVGGLVFTTLNKDFSATIRALQTVSKLDVLSRPYILASDNQKANFQDVFQWPFASGSRADVNGNVDTTVTWQTLGISLNVTPHINPDGLVTMLINPEIDTLTGQTVVIQAASSTSPGLSEQVWGKRIATSQVAVRNGQTIVIGGMIQDEKTDTLNKIPFIGDIPLIGQLFTHTVHDKKKTEVLIFLAPMVATNPEELKALSKVEEEGAGQELRDAVGPGIFEAHLKAMHTQLPPSGPVAPLVEPSTTLIMPPQTPAAPINPLQPQSPQTPAPQTQPPQTPAAPADPSQAQPPQAPATTTDPSQAQPPQTPAPQTPGQ